MHFVLLLLSVALGSCRPSLEQRLAAAREEYRIDPAVCEETGGPVKARGMFGLDACVHPFSDADKVCSGSSQCEGDCLIGLGHGDDDPTDATEGKCQPDDVLDGCWAAVEGGKQQPPFCID